VRAHRALQGGGGRRRPHIGFGRTNGGKRGSRIYSWAIRIGGKQDRQRHEIGPGKLNRKGSIDTRPAPDIHQNIWAEGRNARHGSRRRRAMDRYRSGLGADLARREIDGPSTNRGAGGDTKKAKEEKDRETKGQEAGDTACQSRPWFGKPTRQSNGGPFGEMNAAGTVMKGGATQAHDDLSIGNFCRLSKGPPCLGSRIRFHDISPANRTEGTSCQGPPVPLPQFRGGVRNMVVNEKTTSALRAIPVDGRAPGICSLVEKNKNRRRRTRAKDLIR